MQTSLHGNSIVPRKMFRSIVLRPVLHRIRRIPHRTIVRCKFNLIQHDVLYKLSYIPGEDTLPSNKYELPELIDLLEKENSKDIFVVRVPKEVKYVDYMVICSSHNFRSMSALAEIVRRNFKEKNGEKIVGLPSIEGAKSRDWMALDLGNIALHIMSGRSREYYDLEYLWAVGNPPELPPT